MAQQVLSVTQINEYIRGKLDADGLLNGVAIRGEISNYKVYPSGHHYFTLKDEGASLKCVMFKGNAMRLRFRPDNGVKVIAMGKISVYPRDGAYQLYCSAMAMDGIGDLYAAFEQLKAKLAAQGLFDPDHKKPLPKYPATIGIVTSSAGAAVHDMLRILRKRYPLSKVLLLPVRVQGVEAPGEIAAAIRYANYHRLADLLIVGRGGGSIEDLWAFNDEKVAYAIYNSEIPVISAVGHEPDVTISDYVADLRAATPSNAAELAVPDRAELHVALSGVGSKLERILLNKIQNSKNSLKYLRDAGVFSGPASIVNERRMGLLFTARTMDSAMGGLLQKDKAALAATAAKVEALSPLSVLSRGYGVIQDAEGVSVRGVANVKAGDEISIRVRDGRINATVKSTHKERKTHGKNSENL